jgi:tRNA modification GTPase
MESNRITACTVSLLTARGRGAVASIRVSHQPVIGQSDFLSHVPFRAANGKPFEQQTINQIVFGRWGNEPGEEVVVCRTSVDCLEIHCHGGLAAAERIQSDLRELGAILVDWDEQVRKRSGLLKRECEVALSKASTNRTALRLLSQDAAWRHSVLTWRKYAERGDWTQILECVNRMLEWRHFGRHLTEPFQVVLTGQPNVGKSTLINAFVGFQRSIVFDRPGTTRDVVTAEAVWDGWPIRLADTAGLRQGASGLEANGIELAARQISAADLVIFVLDASRSADPINHPYLSQKLQGLEHKTITVANKIDLSPPGCEFKNLGAKVDFLISAQTGVGLDAVIDHACRQLVPSPPAIDIAIPFSEDLVNWLNELANLIENRSIEQFVQHLAILSSDLA